MAYGLRDLGGLLRTPAGRQRIARAALRHSWPLFSRVAAVHRRTIARSCRVVAVCGSFGKTTTARAITAALGSPTRGRAGRNSWTNLALAMLRLGPGDSNAIFEVGIADIGQMAPYARMLRPDVVVVTCIGTEHRRSLGSARVTREEKAHMVRALPASGLAVLNADEAHVLWMARRTRARVVTYGFSRDSDVRASGLRPDWPRGMRFVLHAGDREREVRVRLFGRAMVYPVLASVAVARAEGVDTDEALARVEALAPSHRRLEPVPLPNGAYLLRDEYKSTLETILAAFDALAQVPAGRRLLVLGDVSEPPGSQGPIYRELGSRIAGSSSWAAIVGNQFQRYSAGARRAGMARDRLVRAGGSPLRAAEALRKELRAGDVVLIKGRDTQHMERVALVLQGRRVRCDLATCRRKRSCADCPMLAKGWSGLRPLT
jgi:UDP-N-acetylmuramoyl-tripeptide--D-alanyl-D-alanine ligase